MAYRGDLKSAGNLCDVSSQTMSAGVMGPRMRGDDEKFVSIQRGDARGEDGFEVFGPVAIGVSRYSSATARSCRLSSLAVVTVSGPVRSRTMA